MNLFFFALFIFYPSFSPFLRLFLLFYIRYSFIITFSFSKFFLSFLCTSFCHYLLDFSFFFFSHLLLPPSLMSSNPQSLFPFSFLSSVPSYCILSSFLLNLFCSRSCSSVLPYRYFIIICNAPYLPSSSSSSFSISLSFLLLYSISFALFLNFILFNLQPKFFSFFLTFSSTHYRLMKILNDIHAFLITQKCHIPVPVTAARGH